MKPTARVKFTWKDELRRNQEFYTLGIHFKTHAILLLEDNLDKGIKTYYSVDNSTPVELDYYNADI